jgi:hypothetical protein
MPRERYFVFALIGGLLFIAGLFAGKHDGIRWTVDTVALYAGLGLCVIQVAIWLFFLTRWNEARRAPKRWS